MRKTSRVMVAALAALALALPAAAQAQVPYPLDCEDLGSSKVTKPGPFKALPQEVVEVPSKVDGRPQQIGFIRPDAPAGYRAPVIVHASSYHSRDLKDADIAACARFLTENFVQHGYAVALVPTRGVGDTDGCPNMFGAIERSDLDDALTWLGTQPWSNGNVAMYGISYSGSTPWVAAATGNPHLKTIVPASGVNDLFDLALGAGTLDSRFWFFVSGYYHYYGPVLNNPVVSGRDPERTVNAATTCPDVVAGRGRPARERRHRRARRGRLLGRAQPAPARRAQLPRQRAARPGADRLERPARARDPVDGLAAASTASASTSCSASGTTSTPTPRARTPAGTGPTGCSRGSTTSSRATTTRAARPAGRGRGLLRQAGAGPTRWPPANGDVLHLTAGRRAGGRARRRDREHDARARLSAAATTTLGQGDGQHNTDDLPPVSAAVDEPCATCATFRMPVDAGAAVRRPARGERRRSRRAAASGHVTAFLYRKDADGLHRLGWGMTDLRFPEGENSGDETAAEVVAGRADEGAHRARAARGGRARRATSWCSSSARAAPGRSRPRCRCRSSSRYGDGQSTMSLAFVDPPQRVVLHAARARRGGSCREAAARARGALRRLRARRRGLGERHAGRHQRAGAPGARPGLPRADALGRLHQPRPDERAGGAAPRLRVPPEALSAATSSSRRSPRSSATRTR